MLNFKHSIILNWEKELTRSQFHRFSNDDSLLLHDWRQIYGLYNITVVGVLFAFALFEVIAVFDGFKDWEIRRYVLMNEEKVTFMEGIEEILAVHFLNHSLLLFVGGPSWYSLDDFFF